MPHPSVLIPDPKTAFLRQLASHTSGMPRDLHYPCGFTPTCTENDVLEMMRSMHLVVRYGNSNI